MSTPRTRFVVAVVLSVIMVLSAGCAGFGTDGPVDPAKEFDGKADDWENESFANDTEATDESSEESDGDDEDSNEYDSTDPPESSSEDDPDELPAAYGSDDDGPVDDTDSTNDADGTNDTEEDGPGSGTNSDQSDTSDSADDGSGDGDASPEDDEGDDAPVGNGRDDDADDGESGEEEPVYTLTVEADSPVTLERTWEDASTTREPTDGTVEFSVIEGSYTLSADGYYDVPEEVAIQVDSDTTVTMQSEDGADVEVTVVDAETGEGIEGAEISGVCDWYYSSGDVYVTGETDADGVANASAELSPTNCDATVSAEGYASENVDLAAPDDDGLAVALEPEESGRPRPTP